jgi:leucyl aminopeptidase (aminopeptidase T)
MVSEMSAEMAAVYSAPEITRRMLAETMGVKPDEKMAIISNHLTDLQTLPLFAKATLDLKALPTIYHFHDGEMNTEAWNETKTSLETMGVSVIELQYPDGDGDAQQAAVDFMSHADFDVAVRVATDCVQLSNSLFDIAIDRGVAMAEMPGITYDDMKSPVFMESIERMQEREDELRRILTDATEIRIISDRDGTDLRIKLDPSQDWVSDPANFSGRGSGASVDNLPGREIYKNPLPTQTDGKIVLHHLDSYVDRNVEVDEPIVLTFAEGKIVEIQGGVSAQKLRDYINETAATDKDSSTWRHISEVAFGLNFLAPKYEGSKVSTLVREKAPTFHFAIGDTPNRETGEPAQEMDSDVHLDFVLDRNTFNLEVTHRDGRKELLFGPTGALERYGQ